jgi:hypothetical protein
MRGEDVACGLDEVLTDCRKKDERGWADRTWRKGRMGYRKRTSLWEIRLMVKVTMMHAHDRRANILRETMSSSEEIECCDTELDSEVCSLTSATE